MADLPPPPPPSYEDATSRDWLVLVTRYVHPEDYYNAALVSKHWNAIFIHELWGEPHRCWENNNWSDASRLKSFLLFLLELTEAHPDCLASVHSLDLRGLYSSLETWGSTFTFPPDWLARMLICLPNLTSFYGVKNLKVDRASLEGLADPHYNLQELSLADCEIGAENIAFLLQWLPRLRMLDLRGVRAAKEDVALNQMCKMEYISELRLPNVGLKDNHLEQIAKSFGTRLEVLDVKSNSLTDKSIQHLLDYCFRPPDYYSESPGPQNWTSSGKSGIHSLAISGNWSITPSAALRLLQTSKIKAIDIGHINIPGTAFFPSQILPSLEETCKTVLKLRIDFRVVCATVVDGNVILPRWSPAAFPTLEVLVLEGLPYHMPKDYCLTSQLKELLLDLYSYEKTHPTPQLRQLVLEVSPDEDPTWVPDDGSSVFPRFPAKVKTPASELPPSFAEAEEEEDDGGWAHVKDFGTDGAELEKFEGQDFSFFNEPYMKVPELRDAVEPRSPKVTQPRRFSNAAPIPQSVPKDAGLVNVSNGVERILKELRAERKMWSGKVLFGKYDETEMGSFL